MKQEIPRKIFHILFGAFFIVLIYFLGAEQSIWVISVFAFVGFVFALAIKSGVQLKFIGKIISIVERDHEEHFPGKAALLFFASAIILLLFFGSNVQIVLAALSVSIFADAGAALVGKKFGRIKIAMGKTLEGSAVCFILATTILILFFPLGTFSCTKLLIIALLATLVEYLPINDNISMPVVVAVTLSFLPTLG